MQFPAEFSTEKVLLFAKLSIDTDLLLADATFLVKVDEELRWTLSCHGIVVEVDKCCDLLTIPPQLHSAGALLDLLHALQAIRGNPVSDFQSLVDVHGTNFMDSTGMISIANCPEAFLSPSPIQYQYTFLHCSPHI